MAWARWTAPSGALLVASLVGCGARPPMEHQAVGRPPVPLALQGGAVPAQPSSGRIASAEGRPVAAASADALSAGLPAADPLPAGRSAGGPAAIATACPQVAQAVARGHLRSSDLREVSGVTASRSQPGVLWVHNDSGDAARLFALSENGEVLLELALAGANAEDFEDIASGPGPEPGKSYLYVGDIGDNSSRRETVQIYRLEEPRLDPAVKVASAAVHRLDFSYEDGPHDAEALVSDPVSGDLFIVAKGPFFPPDGSVGVYRLARRALQGKRATATRVGAVPMGPVTAADVLPDGSGIAIRNYVMAGFWPRPRGTSLVAALGGPGCPLPLADLGAQGEAFCFAADGRGYFTLAEGEGQPLYFHPFE